MDRIVAYKGLKFTVAYALEKSGTSPGAAFFNDLSLSDKAKLLALFKRIGDHGEISNPEKFGSLGDGLWEFKSFQVRMPFAYCKKQRGWIVITHGFIKKKDKAPQSEIDRAWKIFKEDQEHPLRLTVIKKPRT